MTTPTAAPGIDPGVYLQLYRSAIRGNTLQARRDTLARYVREIAGMRAQGLVAGVVFHGFCEDLRDAWPRLEALAATYGVPAGASWGLDGRDLSARAKGDLVGQVLAAPKCRFGLLDAEGQWDSDLGPADDLDEQGALELGEALRRRAPSARVGDQPWYAIEAHGDVRRTARPIEHGGVFRGFPVVDTAYNFVITEGQFWEAIDQYVAKSLDDWRASDTGGDDVVAAFGRGYFRADAIRRRGDREGPALAVSDVAGQSRAAES
jgi:hypothetical protein